MRLDKMVKATVAALEDIKGRDIVVFDVRRMTAMFDKVIVASGAAEANALGLTTQVPIREVFLTSGASRTLHLGNRTVQLQHANGWLLSLGKRPAGMAIRALSWLGPEEGASAIKVLREQLPAQEWAAMRSARAMLPSWMARAVSLMSEARESG